MPTGLQPPSDDLPYASQAVTFVQWRSDGTVLPSNNNPEKRQMLVEDLPLFAAWTGRYRTDVFAVDVSAARRALGVVK